jgi:hypothetical protein
VLRRPVGALGWCCKHRLPTLVAQLQRQPLPLALAIAALQLLGVQVRVRHMLAGLLAALLGGAARRRVARV